MAQFVVGPALQELGHFDAKTEEGRNAITLWRSLLVYVPALAGGVFGLLGGYMTDLFGRPPRPHRQHFPLRLLRSLCRLLDVAGHAADSAQHHVYWRVR